ncbi:unnamed protein product, partial [Strongylus vulgaris]
MLHFRFSRLSYQWQSLMMIDNALPIFNIVGFATDYVEPNQSLIETLTILQTRQDSNGISTYVLDATLVKGTKLLIEEGIKKASMTGDEKHWESEALSLRRVAFVGVALSTAATLVCIISVPMLYNYMQHMQSVMQNEVDFCKSRSGNIWREVTRTQASHNTLIINSYSVLVLTQASTRTRRQAGGGCC